MKTGKTNCFFTKLSAGFLIVIPWIAFASRAIAQTTVPAGHSTIHGRAIYQDTERPVRRASVVLLSDEGSSQSRSSVTDGQGEFSFKNLTAGRYHVVVNYPGYLNGFPQIDLNKRKASEVTVDGTSSAEIVVRAERGGVITGKITYPDGEPAVGAQINVFIKAGKRWSHAPFVSSGAQTDDRGIYRIYTLEPGEYVISVIEQSLVIEEREGGTMQTVGNKSLNPYFYADASTLKSARVIPVEAGREVNNINITLAERATYKVAGTIVAGGKPLSGAYLRLGPSDEGLGGPTSMRPYGIPARADKEGQWVFPDVPDGTYEVELDSTSDQFNERSQDGGNERRQKFISQPLRVTVAGADVTDLVMSLSLSGRISGSIIVEGEKPLPRSLDVVAELFRSDRSEYMASGRVDAQAKGAFLIEGVAAGENILKVNVWNAEYFAKSITWNSRDLLRQPLKVPEGGELKDIRIILSSDMGRLTGHMISEENRKPLSSMPFMLIPADETRWTRMDSFLFLYTDKQGAFKATGPPGEYILLLMQPLRENQLAPLDYVRAHAATGTRVTLKPGEPGDVEVVASTPW